ncbi:bifunctional oligoribonuclease/PAP phosphatase NrnA [Desulfallas sp. Bu1-1]|uniref:DHH family phosphoesterase n=1 Tax=Desulfallas sp. Bu1-1 TaxID=2787620 RepID=UPI0018A0CE33|nr:bifunctional oligoribonuclease/PAP phosphatase NrnA [Desulfallas sp. Bu1-1]MBF7082374.1 bifunctional oligoribonuclease/PAP phosphatase NrnA [Desulfallas sp. Bu1-1]
MDDREKLLSAAADALCHSQRVAVCGHVMPDGDCLGSVLALGRALQKLGKDVVLLSPGPVPEVYSFLPGADEIRLEVKEQDEFDVFVSVDCSVPDRLGHFKDLLHRAGRVITVDHHAGAFVFGHIYLNDPEAGAAGEIIYDLLKLLPVKIDVEMGSCLYVAIITDTGSFRYDNTGPKTHLQVAELMKLGIPAARINKLLYEEKPLVSMLVLREVLKTLNISPCGRVSWMSISRDTLNRLHASDEHVDGLINYPRMIKGVELALFFKEMENNKYKISFRSKYYLDVNKLASLFGGGGHSRAAGCIMEGDLNEIQQRVYEAALIALRDWSK